MHNIKKIKAVLFDLDGVLVEACEWHYQALNDSLVFNSHKPIDRLSHETTFNGLPTRTKLNLLGITDEVVKDKINRDKQRFTIKIILENAKYDQQKTEIHEYLRANDIKIACVTNSIRETAKLMLEKTGQYNYLDLLITNEDVLRNKPFPDCYNKAIDYFGLKGSEVLCVEDSENGIAAAKNSLSENLLIVKNSKDLTLDKIKKFIL